MPEPGDHAIIRLVGAPMLRSSDERAVARRYMSLEAPARHRPIPPSGCPPRGPPDQPRTPPKVGALAPRGTFNGARCLARSLEFARHVH